MSTIKIKDLSLENAAGETVLFKISSGNPKCNYRGPTTRHFWVVEGKPYQRLNPRNDYLRMLPDSTGFLLCENVERQDNLVLLDTCGKERMRLSVPWKLTKTPTPESAHYPSRFIGITTPWDNPETGEQGKFGVLAWMQYSGDYCFELDYTTGQFLWGYFLERG